MPIKLGLDAKLYRNTGTYAVPVWSEITNVRDLTLSLEEGEADVTTRANGGWRATAGTLKDASVEFEMVWDSADTEFQAIRDAFLNDTTIEMLVLDDDVATPGSQGLRAEMRVASFSRSEELEEAIKVSVSLKPAYATNPPEWFTAV